MINTCLPMGPLWFSPLWPLLWLLCSTSSVPWYDAMPHVSIGHMLQGNLLPESLFHSSYSDEYLLFFKHQAYLLPFSLSYKPSRAFPSSQFPPHQNIHLFFSLPSQWELFSEQLICAKPWSGYEQQWTKQTSQADCHIDALWTLLIFIPFILCWNYLYLLSFSVKDQLVNTLDVEDI